MDQRELKATIDKLATMIEADLPKATREEEIKFAAFALLGLSILGELLVDIKRIADAADLSILTEVRVDWGELSPEKREAFERLMADIRQRGPVTAKG